MNDPLNLLTHPPPSPIFWENITPLNSFWASSNLKLKKKKPKENFDTKNSLKNKKHMPIVHPNTYRKSFFFFNFHIKNKSLQKQIPMRLSAVVFFSQTLPMRLCLLMIVLVSTTYCSVFYLSYMIWFCTCFQKLVKG